MKRVLFVSILVVVLMAVGAVVAIAAPGAPGQGFGMMGGYGMMGRIQGVLQGGYGPYGMMGPGAYGMMGDDLEELLGIDHADIHAAHVSGRSLVDIAAEKGVTEDELIQTLLDGRKAALQQAVDAGALTQDSADQMLRFMESNIKLMVEAKGMASMPGTGMMGGWNDGTGSGGCHGGQAPQGAGIGNDVRPAARWSQKG